MSHIIRVVLVAGVLISAAGVAASQQSTQQPGVPAQPPATTPPQDPAAPGQQPATGQQPAPPGPVAPGAQVPAPPAAVAVPPIPVTPAGPLPARTFTAGCGLLLHPVRPERVQDFELFLDYLRDAISRSTNPRVRSQAQGWRFFKAAEAGPNGVALYIFWIDPAVPGAEYALGPILAEVYTDPAQLAEIWALYTSSVTSGGTLMNLTPVMLRPPPPIATPPVNAPVAGQKPGAPAPGPAATVPPVATVPGAAQAAISLKC